MRVVVKASAFRFWGAHFARLGSISAHAPAYERQTQSRELNGPIDS